MVSEQSPRRDRQGGLLLFLPPCCDCFLFLRRAVATVIALQFPSLSPLRDQKTAVFLRFTFCHPCGYSVTLRPSRLLNHGSVHSTTAPIQ